MPLAQLIFFDPGQTTGMAVLCCRPGWLEGRGDPGFEGLGRACSMKWAAQVGRNARVWSATGRAARPTGHVVTGSAWLSRRKARAGSAELSYSRAEILDVVSECHALLDEYPDAAWGHESFQLRPGARSGEVLSAVEVFSALTYGELAYGEHARAPFEQTPAMAKATVDDLKLRAAGCYYAGMPHANDAMRHALLFLRDARDKADLRAQAWPRIFDDRKAAAS